MSSNVIFLWVQSLEIVSILFLANKLALISCSFKTTLIINASTWPFYSFFFCVFSFLQNYCPLKNDFSPDVAILNSLELWHLLIISLHLYILLSCKVFCYFWISYSLKENEFPLLSVFGIKCRRGFDHMHVTYIYISTIHVADACNQMKWPIKQYHQGIGVPLFLERY